MQEHNDVITGCINVGQVADWSTRIRSMHYDVKYRSKAGLVFEREAYVILFRDNDGLWFVSTDTQLDPNGIHFTGE